MKHVTTCVACCYLMHCGLLCTVCGDGSKVQLLHRLAGSNNNFEYLFENEYLCVVY